VTDVDSQSVTLKWKAPEKDGGLPIKQYIVERREAKRQAWVKADSVRGGTTTCVVDRLMEGSHYVFRVSAENDEGLSPPLESDAPVTCRRAPGKAEDCTLLLLTLALPLNPALVCNRQPFSNHCHNLLCHTS